MEPPEETSTPAPNPRWAAVTLDCSDSVGVARFWGAFLGLEIRDLGRAGWYRIGPRCLGDLAITFQPVPEPKVTKDRMHLDIRVDDLGSAEALVRELGGRLLDQRYFYDQGTVSLVSDPEGHEFCLVALDRDDETYP